MPDFDFRKAMGGKVEVAADDKLADGINFEEMAADASHQEVALANSLAGALTNDMLIGCLAAKLGIGGVTSLVVARVGHMFRESGPADLDRFLAAMRYRLDELERGEC
jgi:hypothetical protein